MGLPGPSASKVLGFLHGAVLLIGWITSGLLLLSGAGLLDLTVAQKAACVAIRDFVVEMSWPQG